MAEIDLIADLTLVEGETSEAKHSKENRVAQPYPYPTGSATATAVTHSVARMHRLGNLETNYAAEQNRYLYERCLVSQAKVAELNQQLDRAIRKIDEVKQRLDEVKQRLSEVKQRLDEVKRKYPRLRKKIKQVEQGTGPISAVARPVGRGARRALASVKHRSGADQ